MPGPGEKLIEEGFYEYKKNARKGYCWVKGCRRSAKTGWCMCHMHEMRRWRKKNKQIASYCTLRDHAKARKLEFKISLEYWKGLTDGFAFYEAEDGELLTIDRIDPTKGYIRRNMRVVGISLNVAKGNRERYLPEHVRAILQRQREETRAERQDYLDLDADDSGFYDSEEPEESEDPNIPF